MHIGQNCLVCLFVKKIYFKNCFFAGECDRSISHGITTDLSYFPELPPLREYNSLLKAEFSELQDLGSAKTKIFTVKNLFCFY